MTNSLYLTTKEATKVLPVSERILQWLDERGVIVPMRNNRDHRLYSEQNMFAVVLHEECRNVGISQIKLNMLMEDLISSAIDSNSNYLVVCVWAEDIRAICNVGDIPFVLRNMAIEYRKPCYLIDLKQVRETLREALRQVRELRKKAA